MKFDIEILELIFVFLFLIGGFILLILRDNLFAYLTILFAFSTLILVYMVGIDKKLDKLQANFVQQASDKTKSKNGKDKDVFSKGVQSDESPSTAPTKNNSDSLRHG